MNLLAKVKKHHDSKQQIYDYATLSEIEQLIKENYQVIVINVDKEQPQQDQEDETSFFW